MSPVASQHLGARLPLSMHYSQTWSTTNEYSTALRHLCAWVSAVVVQSYASVAPIPVKQSSLYLQHAAYLINQSINQLINQLINLQHVAQGILIHQHMF